MNTIMNEVQFLPDSGIVKIRSKIRRVFANARVGGLRGLF
jgi:3-methyladenine DNA glycosylase Tag